MPYHSYPSDHKNFPNGLTPDAIQARAQAESETHFWVMHLQRNAHEELVVMLESVKQSLEGHAGSLCSGPAILAMENRRRAIEWLLEENTPVEETTELIHS